MRTRFLRMKKGDEFLNWDGRVLIFDPSFENIKREGINAYDYEALVASITWSSHSDYTFLRSAFVDNEYRGNGIFHTMFDTMISLEGKKPVKGQWRTGGPLELFMASWNERWRENG